MSDEKPLLGRDLKLVDTELGSDLKVSRDGDIETVSDEFNLGQAIIHRLRTRVGELSDIGHSNYGSRLYDLIGEVNSETTRERAKLIVKRALENEPRISKIVNIAVRTSDSDPSVINIDISVIAVERNIPLNLVFPFHLELA